MKFTLSWIECHDPANWCDKKTHSFSKRQADKILKECMLIGKKDSWDGEKWVDSTDTQYNLGVLNILASVPNGELDNIFDDGWIEITAKYKFTAKTIDEAKAHVQTYLDEHGGLEMEVFSVWNNDKNERAFDEQDFYQEN